MLFASHTNKKKRICLIILLCILFLLVSFFSFQTIIYADDVESLYVEYIGEIGNENQQQDSENYVVKAVLKNGKTKTVRSSEVDIAVKNNVATLAYKGVEAEYFFTEQIEFVPSSDDDPDEIIILDIPKTESGQEQNNSSNTISEELDSSDTSQPDETADVSVPTEVTSNTASDAAASSGTSSAATSTEGETGGGNLPYPPNPPTPSIVTIAGMVVISPPLKTTYLQGESFDTKGLVIKVIYSNGTSKFLENMKAPPNKLMPADKTIVMTYKYGSSVGRCDIPITVIPRTPITMTIINAPDKIDYIEDMKFDAAGMTVKIEFDNGDIVDTGFTISTPIVTFGQKQVEISYSENGTTLKETINITVVKKTPVSLAVVGTPIKQIEDISFNPANLTVKGTYDNGKTYTVTGYTYDKKILVVGEDKISFGYTENGATVMTDLDITAVKKTPVSLAVVGTPIKQIEDIPFDPSNLTVKGTYDNGKTYVVTGYTFDYKLLAVGADTIPFSYIENGVTVMTELDITVVKKTPTKLNVVTLPTKTSYIEDTKFNKSGLTLSVTYDNKKTSPVSGFVIDTADLAFGQKITTVSYTENGATVTTNVTIKVAKKTPLSLAIEGTLVKQIEDISFNPANLTVKGTYDNGKKYIVTDCTFADVQLVEGQSAVEISYTENLGTVTVTYNLPSPVGPQQAVWQCKVHDRRRAE